MIYMIFGLLLFLGVHSLNLFAEDWRRERIERWGLWPYKIIYSLVSLVGLVVLVWGFGQMRQESFYVWHPPIGLQHGILLLMLPAMILLVAAYFPKNHIKAKLGHPMLLAVKVWALSHLLVNGRMGDIVFFGAFLVWGIMLYGKLRRRDRQEGNVPPQPRLLATVATVILGVVTWYIFAMYLHIHVTGVPAFTMGMGR